MITSQFQSLSMPCLFYFMKTLSVFFSQKKYCEFNTKSHQKPSQFLWWVFLTHMSHVMWKPVLAICEHSRSLISTFVVRYLDNIIPILAKSKISRLASLCSWAGRFESYLVGNSEDRFSRDGTGICLVGSTSCRLDKSICLSRVV